MGDHNNELRASGKPRLIHPAPQHTPTHSMHGPQHAWQPPATACGIKCTGYAWWMLQAGTRQTPVLHTSGTHDHVAACTCTTQMLPVRSKFCNTTQHFRATPWGQILTPLIPCDDTMLYHSQLKTHAIAPTTPKTHIALLLVKGHMHRLDGQGGCKRLVLVLDSCLLEPFLSLLVSAQRPLLPRRLRAVPNVSLCCPRPHLQMPLRLCSFPRLTSPHSSVPGASDQARHFLAWRVTSDQAPS